MDRDSIGRIRSATFPVGRRGYEKREVDRFLNKLADWLMLSTTRFLSPSLSLSL